MKKAKKRLLTSSILITASTAAIYVINKMISASAIFKNILSSKESDFYEWRFGNVYYKKSGNGNPILLIHDLSVYGNDFEFNKIVQQLEKNHTVYTIDLLGCGRSDRPKITCTNFLYVQLITDFVKNVIKQKTDVIASGLSSSFVIMTCLNDNSVFEKIMLISPEDLAVLNQAPTKQSKIAKFMLELPIIGTLLYHMIVCKPNVELLFTEKYLFNPFHTEQSYIDTYYESAHKENSNGKYLQSSIAGHYVYCNIAHALKEINNSIFILSGEKTEGIQETIALYKSLNSSIESELIEKTKQMPHIENPEKVLETIDIFFSYDS
jgi:pimeloyl-ACP methyl ester carboxylesterase